MQYQYNNGWSDERSRRSRACRERHNDVYGLQVGILSSLHVSPSRKNKAMAVSPTIFFTSVCGARLPQVLMSFRFGAGCFSAGGVDVQEHTEHSGTLCTQYCQVCFHHTINYVTQLNCFFFLEAGLRAKICYRVCANESRERFCTHPFSPLIFFHFWGN